MITARICSGFMALALCMGLLTGCWDRKEMDELAFVMASGIDLTDDGKLETTLQIALPTGIPNAVQSGGKAGKSYMVVSAIGNDGIDSLNNLQQQLSRKINLGHRRVFIISEKLGRQGLNQVMDTLLRAPESRYNSYIITSYGTTAKSIVGTPYLLEKIPAIGISNIVAGGYTISTKTDEFLDAVASYGNSPVTPAIQIVKTDNGGPTIILNRIAVYHENKLAGFLSGEKKTTFRLLRGESKNISWSLQFQSPKNEYKGTVNLIFLQTKTSIHTHLSEGKISVSIDLKASGRLISNDTDLDFSKSGNIARLEQKYEEELQQAIKETVSHVQRELRSDIFGFGGKVHIEHPHEWKKLKGRWDEVYPTIPVQVRTDVRIERIGRTLAPGHLKK